jgi:hypothetical protein
MGARRLRISGSVTDGAEAGAHMGPATRRQRSEVEFGFDRHAGGYRCGSGGRGRNVRRAGSRSAIAARRHRVCGFGLSGPSTLARPDWLVVSELVLTGARSREAFQAKCDMRARQCWAVRWMTSRRGAHQRSLSASLMYRVSSRRRTSRR